MIILKIFDFYIILFCLSFFFLIYYVITVLNISENILKVLFLFEILILLTSFLFLVIGLHYNDIYGQIVVIFLLTVAAVEASLGLALIYVYYKHWRTVRLSNIKYLKG